MTNTIILKNGTGIPPGSALAQGELAIDTTGGKLYTKTAGGAVVEIGGNTPPPVPTWVRNPSWLPMPATTSAQEQVDLLVAVYPESSYIGLNFACVGGYTVDWGDGSAPVNLATNSPAQYLFNYNNVNLAGTNGPVTFTESTNTVNRVAHGYTDGSQISFAEIITTTGIVPFQTYLTTNVTADTFQLLILDTQSLVTLVGDGTGAILPYKQTMVKITATNGTSPLTNVVLPYKNTTSGLQQYTPGILDATISAGCTSISVSSNSLPMRLLERCRILRHNTTTFNGLFYAASSLQSVLLANTQNVTVLNQAFYFCSSLKEAPFFDTQNVTSFANTFDGCIGLVSVPLYNTIKVTGMSSMFKGCVSLTTVPLFDTQNVTGMLDMFNGCIALKDVPLFNTIKVTNMQGMFYGCSSLTTAPLFDTQNVQIMGNTTPVGGMFSQCTNLITIPLFNTIKVTSVGYMFANCVSLINVPLFNTQNVIDMQGFFYFCTVLKSVPLFNTIKVRNFGSMFSNCINLVSIPSFNTDAAGLASVSAFSSMVTNCSSIQQFPDMNLNRTSVTVTSSYSSMFNVCPSLSKINLSPGNGPKFTFSVANLKLSAASLNQLYTSLPVVVGQTITVSGNVGISGDDPTIATAKGWTVTGS